MNRKVSIFSISPDGEKTYYSSMKEAADATGICKTSISGAVNFGHKAGGMLWERVEPEKKPKRKIPNLKTCPFCGSIPKVDEYVDRYGVSRVSIECQAVKCKIKPMTAWYASEKEAVKVWEGRA